MTSHKDCIRFYSNLPCNKDCRFRHEPSALGSQTLCPKWQGTWCNDMKCNFRHAKTVNGHFVTNEMCFDESFPHGCCNKDCPFRHEKTPGRKFYTPNEGAGYTQLCRYDGKPDGCRNPDCLARHENIRGIRKVTTTSALPSAPKVGVSSPDSNSDTNGAKSSE